MEGYSIKEIIQEFRDEVKGRFDKVDEAQAHTNGDVKALKVWRGFITGGLAVITVIVVPLVIYIYTEQQNTTKLLSTINTKTTYGDK